MKADMKDYFAAESARKEQAWQEETHRHEESRHVAVPPQDHAARRRIIALELHVVALQAAVDAAIETGARNTAEAVERLQQANVELVRANNRQCLVCVQNNVIARAQAEMRDRQRALESLRQKEAERMIEKIRTGRLRPEPKRRSRKKGGKR